MKPKITEHQYAEAKKFIGTDLDPEYLNAVRTRLGITPKQFERILSGWPLAYVNDPGAVKALKPPKRDDTSDPNYEKKKKDREQKRRQYWARKEAVALAA